MVCGIFFFENIKLRLFQGLFPNIWVTLLCNKMINCTEQVQAHQRHCKLTTKFVPPATKDTRASSGILWTSSEKIFWVLIQLKFAFPNAHKIFTKTKYCFSICRENCHWPSSSWADEVSWFFKWLHRLEQDMNSQYLDPFSRFWPLASPCNPTALTRPHLLPLLY